MRSLSLWHLSMLATSLRPVAAADRRTVVFVVEDREPLVVARLRTCGPPGHGDEDPVVVLDARTDASSICSHSSSGTSVR